MKKASTILIFMFVVIQQLKAHQSIRKSTFWLINKNSIITDIVGGTTFVSASPNPPVLSGYIVNFNSDTLFIKILYKEDNSAGWNSTVYRLDTFVNISLPQNINYLNVSGNIIQKNANGQITDTSWNESDSTFILHPTSLSEHNRLIPQIILYPNPATNNIFIDKNIVFEKVYIFNAMGQKVGAFSKTANAEINVSTLTKGVYFIWIIGKKEEVIGVGKFVKQE